MLAYICSCYDKVPGKDFLLFSVLLYCNRFGCHIQALFFLVIFSYVGQAAMGISSTFDSNSKLPSPSKDHNGRWVLQKKILNYSNFSFFCFVFERTSLHRKFVLSVDTQDSFHQFVYCLQFNVHLGPESPLDER